MQEKIETTTSPPTTPPTIAPMLTPSSESPSPPSILTVSTLPVGNPTPSSEGGVINVFEDRTSAVERSGSKRSEGPSEPALSGLRLTAVTSSPTSGLVYVG